MNGNYKDLTMKRIFVTTVKIAVVVDDKNKAFATISECLSENLEASGAILDWGYVNSTNPFTDKGEYDVNDYEMGEAIVDNLELGLKKDSTLKFKT